MHLSELPITAEMVIPESYLDVLGHMNVMWYTHLFGRSMGGAFKLFGLNREYFVANKAATFALKQLFTYRIEVRVGEKVTIRSRLLGRTAKRLHLMHYMLKGEGEGDHQVLAATAEVMGAHVDMTTRRTSPFPEHITSAFDQLLAVHAALPWDPKLKPEMTLAR